MPHCTHHSTGPFSSFQGWKPFISLQTGDEKQASWESVRVWRLKSAEEGSGPAVLERVLSHIIEDGRVGLFELSCCYLGIFQYRSLNQLICSRSLQGAPWNWFMWWNLILGKILGSCNEAVNRCFPFPCSPTKFSLTCFLRERQEYMLFFFYISEVLGTHFMCVHRC